MDLDYFSHTLPIILPLFFLYTEIHYRFPFIFSRYFKKEPEILADIPHRIGPNKKIPIMLLIKDADKYPIELFNINITIQQNGEILFNKNYNFDLLINQYWWSKIIHVKREKIKGHVLIDVQFNYKVKESTKTILNHNLKLLKPIPFKVYLSNTNLPGNDLVQYGDIHYHSNLTDDMVEYGAPLEPTLEACSALELDFICNTDHSYDLDDKEGSWTETDPELLKWKSSRNEIKKLNNKFNYSPFMVPSEELSMHNSLGRNIHALILNNEEFLPGQGDGAEKLFDFSCEHNSKTLYQKLEKNSLCIASHPFAPVPFLEWLFFKRGVWEDYDVLQKNMSGLQILNGDLDESFFNGAKEWVHYLLDGHKKFIYAGNDAHGNFNMFRQISLPMVKIKESNKQILGVCKTGVFPEKSKNIESTLNALRIGYCFITNGPFINMNLLHNEIFYQMGSELNEDNAELKLNGISTSEFGSIKGYRIIRGIIGQRKEKIIEEKKVESETYNLNIKLNIHSKQYCYYRAEIETFNYRGIGIAMTNPIWLKPDLDFH
jgi:hypothetical protein